MKHAGFSIVRATLVAMTMTALGDIDTCVGADAVEIDEFDFTVAGDGVDCRVGGDAYAFGESSQGSTAEVTASSS